MFFHWRRAAEEGKDYPFARFNKVSHHHLDVSQGGLPILSYLCELSSLLGLAPGTRSGLCHNHGSPLSPHGQYLQGGILVAL